MTDTPEKHSLDVNEIQEIIPHRPPFLLIDRVVETDFSSYVDAVKNVTVNEPFFTGHFPGAPVMPGVLLVEAMAQAAAIMVMNQPQNLGKIPYFMSIDGVKFRRPVVPGDQICLHIETTRMRGSSGKASAVARVDDVIVAEATLAFVIADPPAQEK